MPFRLALLLCALGVAFAQDPKHETVVVTGAFEPIPLSEADRAVHVLLLDENQRLLACSIADFLRLDSSVDLRARAPNGVQSDLSIWGSDFGQTLVLLNGIRLSDAQSAHHNMDIPLPADVVSRVEILKGSGSAYYGSDAVGGVVNLITKQPETTELRLRAAIGNFGVNQQSGTLSVVDGKLSQQFAFSRDFSTGFRDDRDYRNLSLAWTTHWVSALGATDIVLGNTDRPFGAAQFYGNFNSWERTREWFASFRQDLGQNTEASFAYRRHTDLFVLFRNDPQYFTNRHVDEDYQGAARRHDSLARNVTLSYGVESYHDSIDSNNLGIHDRSRGAAYVALDVRALRRFSFTVGGREEIYTGLANQFSPTASVGFWLSSHFKLRAGASRAFRLPSYTDLYYHDPANVGSPNLRPERATGFEGGIDWNANRKIRGDVTVFHRRMRDVIDYVRSSPSDIWRATNFQRLNFTGVETSMTATLGGSQQLELRYTGLSGVQDSLAGVQSKYVFNYPTHSGVIAWQATLPGGLLARTRLDVLKRFDRDPYAVWDFYLASSRGRFHPFLQFTNLTDTRYDEILGVAMPTRGVVIGIDVLAYRHK